ncbi:MAG: HPP family protein [Nanoarchaeota archaeon]|nr:HPP family protein [Nanoarchaeota archaeon]
MNPKEVLKEEFIPAIFGGLAIFMVSAFSQLTVGTAILFASLGTSTVILSVFPDIRMAKLRVMFFAYLIGAGVGYALSFLGPHPWVAGLGLFLTIAIMLLTGNAHTSAGGVALAFIFEPREPIALLHLMISVLSLLVILKSVIYLYKKELHLKNFHHEFLR